MLLFIPIYYLSSSSAVLPYFGHFLPLPSRTTASYLSLNRKTILIFLCLLQSLSLALLSSTSCRTPPDVLPFIPQIQPFQPPLQLPFDCKTISILFLCILLLASSLSDYLLNTSRRPPFSFSFPELAISFFFTTALRLFLSSCASFCLFPCSFSLPLPAKHLQKPSSLFPRFNHYFLLHNCLSTYFSLFVVPSASFLRPSPSHYQQNSSRRSRLHFIYSVISSSFTTAP